MYLLSSISELSLKGVADRGVPHRERIAVKNESLSAVNLAPYFLMVALQTEAGGIPLNDQLFWFGELTVDPGHWVFVYTGPGTPRLTTTTDTHEGAIVMHWGRPKVLFTDMSLVPMLSRMGALVVNQSPAVQTGQTSISDLLMKALSAPATPEYEDLLKVTGNPMAS